MRTFAFSAASLLAFPATVQEAWPARPVTLVVPYPPGNAADISGRLLLEPLSTEIGQRLVIDNRAEAARAVAEVPAVDDDRAVAVVGGRGV